MKVQKVKNVVPNKEVSKEMKQDEMNSKKKGKRK